MILIVQIIAELDYSWSEFFLSISFQSTIQDYNAG